MFLHDCVINWDAPAILRDPNLPNTQGAEWVGDPAYGGTVGGAVRQFRALPAEQQKRVEMWIDSGVVAGLAATIVSYEDLHVIANRSDAPRNE